VQRAVAPACNALVHDVCIVKHHPEQYFITFIHQHHFAIAVGRGPIPVEQVPQWRLEPHADNVFMNYHVRVELEKCAIAGMEPAYCVKDPRQMRITAFLYYIEPRSFEQR
jgi:hypothetical protein